MKVLVCGGRAYNNRIKVYEVLGRLHDVARVVHGGATGADTLAGLWADEYNVPCNVYYAEWEEYGRRAGPIRNQFMLDNEKPDLVVAFPGGRGTADMVKRAKDAGVRVMEIQDG